MLIEPIFRHEEPNLVSFQRQKISADDELYIRIVPAEGERNPFGETLFPFSKLADIVDALNILGVEINEEEVVTDEK